MAWWDVVTKPFEDAYDATKDAAEKAARETERLAREAAEATQRAAEEVARVAAEQAAEAQRVAEAAARVAAEQAAEAQRIAEEAARETQRLAEEAARKAEELAAEAAKIATDTYNYAKYLENDVEARTVSIAATVASTSTELANAGLDITSDEFNKLSAEVEKQVIAGIDIVDDYAWAAYAWLDENACRLGLTAAISMGCVAAFTPAQPAGAATSTTLSLMATPVLYIADMAAKMAVSTAMGSVVADGFLAIPGVGGSVDPQLLKNVCSNCIYYSLDSAALWATPAGVGIAIGAAVAPVVASLVCTRTCPDGFSKALVA